MKDIKYDERTKQVRKCEKCGHSVDFRNVVILYKLCSWCGSRIYRNDKAKFKIELEERLKRK